MYYFAYGSNMNPDRMSDRGVQFDSYQYGHLHHYTLRSNKISKKYKTMGFVNIEPCFEDSVFGVLYSLPSTANLEELDRKEGYPAHYEKCMVPVYTKDGMVLALVYIATRDWSNEMNLPMPAEYKAMVESGLGNCEDLVLESKDGDMYETFLSYRSRIENMIKI